MTKAEKEDESKDESPIKLSYHKINEVHDLIEAASHSIDTEHLKPTDIAKTATTFRTDIPVFCLDKIVMAKYLQHDQEWIRNKCAEGQLLE